MSPFITTEPTETTIQEQAAIIALLLNSLILQVEDKNVELADAQEFWLGHTFKALAAINKHPDMGIPTEFCHKRFNQKEGLFSNFGFSFLLNEDWSVMFPRPTHRLIQ